MKKYGIIKIMKCSKKIWITFLSFLPFGAAAAPLWLVGLGAGLLSIAGYSIYRSNVPVDMIDSLKFFSTCWSCQLFSDVMSRLSAVLPVLYGALGRVTVTMVLALSGIWIAWRIASNFIESKYEKAWNITSEFTSHFFKAAFICALLVMPLPRMISNIAIEPIFNVGLTLNRMTVQDEDFNKCVVATAVMDTATIDSRAVNSGAFSPRFRHNLTCELAGIHQVTGVGIATGWTVLNMAFDSDYMFSIFNAVPIFPNLILMAAGVILIALYLTALLPIPMYFLEVFITLALDLVMLPLMMLAWLFKGWKITLDGAGKSIRKIIDDILSATLGIGMTCVFVSFSIMLMDVVIGNMNGVNALKEAFQNNDSKFLMDALMMNNDSFILLIMIGLFFTMFMNMIPALMKSLFNVSVSTKFYDDARNDIKAIYEGSKKWLSNIKK